MTEVVVLWDDSLSCWRLHTITVGMGLPLPAGERLRKGCQLTGNPYPVKQYNFTDKADAELAAKQLQHYIKTEYTARSQKRKKR